MVCIPGHHHAFEQARSSACQDYHALLQAASGLSPGTKDRSLFFTLAGTVLRLQSLSKRLLFLVLQVGLCDEGQVAKEAAPTLEVVVKDRDGFFTPAQVAEIAAAVSITDRVIVEGFIERLSGPTLAVSLHASSLDIRPSLHKFEGLCKSPAVLFLPEAPHPGDVSREGTLESACFVGCEADQGKESLDGTDEGPEDNQRWGSASGVSGCQLEVPEDGHQSVGRKTSAKNGKRCRPANNDRAAKFASWLVEMYGVDRLSSGSGVLDVAGGQGALAFTLYVRYGIPTTVIDPRPVRYTAQQRRVLYRKAVNQGRLSALHLSDSLQSPEQRSASCSGSAGLLEREDLSKGGPLQQVQRLFDEVLISDPQVKGLWDKCSLVVGMHPDEATDAIVELALKHDKSFAVVPCCVFPSRFPWRHSKEGLPVTTYNDYLGYLRGLSPSIEEGSLAFGGRNRVLFKTSN